MGNRFAIIAAILCLVWAANAALFPTATPFVMDPWKVEALKARDEAALWKGKYIALQERYNVTATAYHLNGQTKNGAIATLGHIAVSRDLKDRLMNKKVELITVEGIHMGSYIVTDTMSAELRNSIDIYLPKGAKAFGRKPCTLRVIG